MPDYGYAGSLYGGYEGGIGMPYEADPLYLPGNMNSAKSGGGSGLWDILGGGLFGGLGSGLGALFGISQQNKMMSWQERMSNTQYQRAVADMKAAGLNPMMMYGRGASAGAPMGSAQQVSMDNPLASMSDAMKQTGRLSALELSQLDLNRQQVEAGVMSAKANAALANAQAVKTAGPDTDVATNLARVTYEQIGVEHIRQDVERWKARAMQQGVNISSMDEQLYAAAGRGVDAWFKNASSEDKKRILEQVIAGGVLGGRVLSGAAGVAKNVAPFMGY